MGSYVFAGCPFEMNFENIQADYELFLSAEKSEPLARITVGSFDSIGSTAYGVQYLSNSFEHFVRCESNPASMLFASADWRECRVCTGTDGEHSRELMITAVYSNLCAFKTLFLHSSFVELGGRGILFVGPSGIGKTTQAELWNKYADARIVNGDKAFLRLFDDGAYAYGSPWRGSSDYSLNTKASVAGIVALRQSKVNKIRRMDTVEAMEYFMPHVFLPHWDEECMRQAVSTFAEVLQRVPLWILECRPDEDAVMLTKKSVLGE